MKLTIDTNIINVRGKLPAVNTLERWQAEGKVQLIGTERLKDETASHKKASQKVNSMPNVSEPMVLGVSRLGHAYLAGENSGPGFMELAQVLFPNQKDPLSLSNGDTNDVMHLVSHAHSKNEVFVTNNTKHFIANGRREKLKDGFGIVIMTPEEVVDHLSARHGWE